MIGVEPLTGPGKKRRDVLPYPRRPSADPTKAHLSCGHHACLLDLLEGLAQLLLVLPLRPAQHLDHTLSIDERKPEALGLAPLAVPCGASGPAVPLPLLALPRTVGPGGHLRAIKAQYQHGTAQAPGGHLFKALRHRLAGRRPLQHAQLRGSLLHTRLEALTPQWHAAELTAQRVRFFRGPLGGDLSRRLLPIALCAPRRQIESLIQGINPAASRGTVEVRTLHVHWPPHSLDRACTDGPRWHLPLPLRTTRRLAGQLTTMGVRNNGLAQAAGALLSPLPHGCRHCA